MINARDLMRFTKLSQVIKDNDVDSEYHKKGIYNTKEPEKSFAGNAKSVMQNGVQWYRKRFQKQNCCERKGNIVFESGFAFCRNCGFLHL